MCPHSRRLRIWLCETLSRQTLHSSVAMVLEITIRINKIIILRNTFDAHFDAGHFGDLASSKFLYVIFEISTI